MRTHLLKHPHLRPELFEDLQGAIASAKEEILAAVGGDAQLRQAFDALKAQAEGQLAVLVSEATVHFERGRERGQAEEFLQAIESLRDAERLAEAPGVDPRLLLRIRAVLTGLLYVSGRLGEAVTTGRQAVAVAKQFEEPALLRLAMGNLALALCDSQEYEEARALFLQVLRMDEDAAEPAEIVRTLSNLLLVDVSLQDWKRAGAWAGRLEPAIRSLDKMIGPSETSLNALGNIGNYHLNLALELPGPLQPGAFERAADMFGAMAEACRKFDLRRTGILAEANLARSLWYLDRYEESDAAFDRAVAAAGDNLGKVAADCRYNQAMMLREGGMPDCAVRACRDALRRYEAIGDVPSARDARQLLAQIDA